MYHDVLAPIGARYGTILMLAVSVRRMEAISLWRTAERGPMEQDRIQLLTLLLPHIRRALEIRQVLGVAQQRTAGAEAMADASATPTFLLTRFGVVVHHNAAAESILGDGDALPLRDGCRCALAMETRRIVRRTEYRAHPPIPSW